ncbi:MAG: PqqD family protein [Sulfolobales archaeon]
MIDEAKKLIKKGDLVGSDGNNFVVALSDEEVYSLDPAAYYIWSLCDGSRTVGDIIQKASEDLSLNKEEIREPIINILEVLLKANLLAEA